MESVLARRSDRISNLPDNVLETILMYLPTRDAVRTSILSRKWRHRWAKLPQLILDGTLWNKSTTKHSARNTIAMILSQLLLVHEGPIKKFTLSLPGLEICPEIDNLIFFLIRNGIKDLTLEMWASECYRLPLSFFTCQKLRHLSLQSCLIETTPSFKGFSRLITLNLHHVTVSAKVLGSLISSCPILTLLDLRFSSNRNDVEIEIEAPNLKTFSFRGITKSIISKNVPLLASVSINTDESIGEEYFRQNGKCNLLEFFHGLPLLKKLHLGYLANKSLAADEVPTRLPTTLVYLIDLKLIKIMVDELNELSFILCLIRSSPNLNRIEIQFFPNNPLATNAVLEFLEEQDDSDVMLNELKEVILKDVTGARPQLKLIEILLAKSPRLVKMQIQNHLGLTSRKGFKFLKELTKFRRASKKAVVIFADTKEKQVCYLRDIEMSKK